MEKIVLTNDNKLAKVQDEAIIHNLISGAKEAELEVFIWRLVGGSKHLANVRIESIRKQRKDFCIIPIAGHERTVQELMSGQGYIDLYVPESALLLRCNIRHSDAPFRYYLHIPDFVAQVERRKSFRLNVYETEDVKISFGKSVSIPRPMSQHFHKSCFDISTGGFSFLVSRMESKFFQINDPIRTIEIKSGGWSTKVNAEIALIKEVEPDEFNGLTYKVWRICCRFNQLDQISKKHLEKYIFERIKDELHAING
ncbi:MAG: PilZ domain-containing protein [Bdellovibrionales bacterium]|nr:PilZ domain-containing protein [Bdellovibrionales bacterium]